MLTTNTFTFSNKKVIIRFRDRACETSDELLSSDLFAEVLRRFVNELKRKRSPLLQVFGTQPQEIHDPDIHRLVSVFQVLAKMNIDAVPKLIVGGSRLVSNPSLLYDFVENLYNYWREFERFVICDSTGDRFDQRPYRTFNSTTETLTHLVRQVYRDIQENISAGTPTSTGRSMPARKWRSLPFPRYLPCPEEVTKS